MAALPATNFDEMFRLKPKQYQALYEIYHGLSEENKKLIDHTYAKDGLVEIVLIKNLP